MKINVPQIDQFIATELAKIKVILLYGPNAGLINFRSKEIVHKVIGAKDDPFSLTNLTFDSIKDEPSRLADESSALSMMGGRRVIVVSQVGASLPKLIQEILEMPTDSLIVLVAGDLAAKSTTRQWAEKSEKAAALPCYQEDGITLRKVIETELAKSNYRAAPDAITYIQQSLSGDRMQVLSEMEKLKTYMGDEPIISLEAVQQIIGNSSESSLEDLVFATMRGDQKQAQKLLERLLYEGTQPIAILRATLRHATRLMEAKSIIASEGLMAKDAMAKLRPPVFFKQAPLFQEQLQRWRLTSLASIIKMLTQAERNCKESGSPAMLICQHTLMNISLRGSKAS